MPIPNEVKLSIVNNGQNAETFTEIDGVRIPGVHTVSFRHHVGELSSVTIELYTRKVTATVNGAEVELVLDDVFRQLRELRNARKEPSLEVSTLDSQYRQYEAAPEE